MITKRELDVILKEFDMSKSQRETLLELYRIFDEFGKRMT